MADKNKKLEAEKIQEKVYPAERKFHKAEERLTFLSKKVEESQRLEQRFQKVYEDEKDNWAKGLKDSFLDKKIDISPLTNRKNTAERKLAAQREVTKLILKDKKELKETTLQLEIDFLETEINRAVKKLKGLEFEFRQKKDEQQVLRRKATEIKDKLDEDRRKKRILEQS